MTVLVVAFAAMFWLLYQAILTKAGRKKRSIFGEDLDWLLSHPFFSHGNLTSSTTNSEMALTL
jgi:hypothetical protein